jgi:MarR family 2-MHQ and catechol resistance regulon transcriptional repressor
MKTETSSKSGAAGSTATAGPDAPATPPQDVPTATALKLWVVLSRATAAVEAHAVADMARNGLTPAEFGVLESLYHKGPLLQGDVAKRTLVSSGGTTFLVDRLEKRGLVERRMCATDRRARYAALTPAGRELMERIFPGHAEVIRRAISGLGLADQRTAVDLLRTLGREAAALSLPGE